MYFVTFYGGLVSSLLVWDAVNLLLFTGSFSLELLSYNGTVPCLIYSYFKLFLQWYKYEMKSRNVSALYSCCVT